MIQADFLRQVEAFQSLEEAQLSLLLELCSERRFARNERLFKEGDPADHLWIVKKGVIDVRFDLPGRETSAESTLSSALENKLLGWSSVVPPYRYRLSAYCASDVSEVVAMESRKLLEFLQQHPGAGYKVFSVMIKIVGERFQRLQASALDAPASR